MLKMNHNDTTAEIALKSVPRELLSVCSDSSYVNGAIGITGKTATLLSVGCPRGCRAVECSHGGKKK